MRDHVRYNLVPLQVRERYIAQYIPVLQTWQVPPTHHWTEMKLSPALKKTVRPELPKTLKS